MATSLRAAFVGKVVPLRVGSLRLELGVVDADHPGVAEGISRLLFRSIGDARASLGGHLPDWLVADVERNYISPAKVRSLWAPFGHRFCVMHDGAIVGTVHLTKQSDTIFTVDRDTCNVSAARFPGFKPERHHHMVNLSVLHELRRARIGSAMIDGIVASFRELFDGDGIWVRADPPWHAGLVGLGFVHDPSRDMFLPESAERTSGLSHAELNARYACDCTSASPFDPEALARRPARMQRDKLQYVSFTRPFDARVASTGRRPQPATSAAVTEVARTLRDASSRGARVIVRGRDQSTAALARGDDGLVLATSSLDAPITHDGAVVTVSGGTTWGRLVRELVPAGLVPKVVPGWLAASVGGTLASGGIGKGSIASGLAVDHALELVVVTGDGRVVRTTPTQAGWLHEAALGGLGHVGVVVEAKLALRRAPQEVAVFVAETPDVLGSLGAIGTSTGTWHATAFLDERGAWKVVQVLEADGQPEPAVAGARCVALTKTLAYLEATRPAPPEGTRTLQVALPWGRAGAWLDVARELASAVGASLQAMPVRRARRRPAGALVDLPGGEAGELVAIALLSLPPGRDLDLVVLRDAALALGGTNLLGGALPEDERAWDAHLGARREAFETARTLADPRGVLTRPWSPRRR